MEDLRLVGLSADGSRLVLENAAGLSLALPLDERVHAALRGDRSRLGQLQIAVDGQLRPREIQARIRAGHSAEEVAASSGLPLDSVRRFETPILLERTHMAQTAQAVGVRRVTDSVTTPLGVLVQARLDEHGVAADTLDWDSWRRDDGRWTVTLAYSAGGRDRTASWVFDPLRRVIEPADDEARWLTDEERAVPIPAPAPNRASRSTGPKLAAVPDPDASEAPREELSDEPADAVAAQEQAPAAVQEPAESSAPAAKARPGGRRASVPSWDEILFGSAPRRDGE
jgi:Protein of unknown function (DUF3071)